MTSRPLEEGVPVAGGALGAAFLVLDDLCADYAALTERIEDELEEIEQQVYDDAVVESRTRIYRLRQQIGKIGRAVSSLATALESSREQFLTVSVAGHEVEPYVRNLLDRLTGTAEVLRDQSSTLDAVVASHENNANARQNDDTRRISAIAALLSVPALTAGVFGMNFGDLPLVKAPLGWAWVLGAAVLRYAVSYDVAEPESATAGLPTLGTDDAADVGTGNLADYLALEVFPTTTAACEPTPNTVDDTLADVGLADAGSGPLDGFTPILGDATTAGFDHGRLLDAGSGSGSSETLCVRVTLDAHAGNALQATGTRIALRFDAVQVVNNPSDTDQQG